MRGAGGGGQEGAGATVSRAGRAGRARRLFFFFFPGFFFLSFLLPPPLPLPPPSFFFFPSFLLTRVSGRAPFLARPIKAASKYAVIKMKNFKPRKWDTVRALGYRGFFPFSDENYFHYFFLEFEF